MGFAPDYVADRNALLGRVHPHDIGIVGPELFRAVQEKRPYDVEGRVRRQDDTYIWVRLRGVPIFDEAGNLLRVAGSLDDITKLKQAGSGAEGERGFLPQHHGIRRDRHGADLASGEIGQGQPGAEHHHRL
jgi:hypothetical protein